MNFTKGNDLIIANNVYFTLGYTKTFKHLFSLLMFWSVEQPSNHNYAMIAWLVLLSKICKHLIHLNYFKVGSKDC